MTDLDCITHDGLWGRVPRADRPRPCFRRDVHYSACEGNGTCRGCVPRSVTHGLLCSACWFKLLDALGRVGDLIVHLRSIDNSGQPLGERVQAARQIKIPVYESWLTADLLLEALGAPPIPSTMPIDDVFARAADAVAEWADPETVVSTVGGAKRAVVLVKRMMSALRRWPDAEAQYRHVPYLLCPNCAQRTLWRRAPLEYLDDLLVECANSPLMYSISEGYDYCEWRMEWDEFATTYGPMFAALIDAEERAAGKPRRPRVVLDTEMTRRKSAECAAGEHTGCRAPDCSCDCHERTYSLWSPKASINRLRELAEADGRTPQV